MVAAVSVARVTKKPLLRLKVLRRRLGRLLLGAWRSISSPGSTIRRTGKWRSPVTKILLLIAPLLLSLLLMLLLFGSLGLVATVDVLPLTVEWSADVC